MHDNHSEPAFGLFVIFALLSGRCSSSLSSVLLLASCTRQAPPLKREKICQPISSSAPISDNVASVDFALTPEARQELKNNRAENEAWKQKVARIEQDRADLGTLWRACLSVSQDRNSRSSRPLLCVVI